MHVDVKCESLLERLRPISRFSYGSSLIARRRGMPQNQYDTAIKLSSVGQCLSTVGPTVPQLGG